MLRFEEAAQKDLPRLTDLWHICFGDPAEDIRRFWRLCFSRIRVFCLKREETLCAMVCVLPLSLVDESGESYDCPYLYAVATAPEERGKGLCRLLMEQTEKSLQAAGAQFVCLVPQEERLVALYEKLGYRRAFYHNVCCLPAEKGNSRIRSIDAAAYENLRQLQLYGNFLSYPDFLLELQQQAGERSGAGLYRIENQDLVCCAAAEKAGETLLLKELLPLCPQAAAELAYALGCKKVMLRSVGTDHAFGMIKVLGELPAPHDAYLGLAFD